MYLDNYDGALHLAAKVQESSNLDERENEQQQSRIRKKCHRYVSSYSESEQGGGYKILLSYSENTSFVC